MNKLVAFLVFVTLLFFGKFTWIVGLLILLFALILFAHITSVILGMFGLITGNKKPRNQFLKWLKNHNFEIVGEAQCRTFNDYKVDISLKDFKINAHSHNSLHDYHRDHGTILNPSSGLPMRGGVDSGGNPYGAGRFNH